MRKTKLHDSQYKALLNLYHAFYAAFILLPNDMKAAFYERLYSTVKLGGVRS